MQITDRERWDAKYAALGQSPLDPPDAFVLRALDALPTSPRSARDMPLVPSSGRALDVAGGRGRHALELARRGFAVEVWDVSPVGLAELERHARALAPGDCAGRVVRTRVLDLVAGPPPADVEPFDLVVVAWFLQRPLVAALAQLVRPGGHALVTTATVDRTGTHPPLAYCLERGELARGLAGFETVLTEERDGQALLLARRSSN